MNDTFGIKMLQLADDVNSKKVSSITNDMISKIMEDMEKAASTGEYSIRLYEKSYPILYNYDKYTFSINDLISKLSGELDKIGLSLVLLSSDDVYNPSIYRVYIKKEKEG